MLPKLAGLLSMLPWLLVAYAWMRGFLPPARHPWLVRERKTHVLVATGASATHGRVSYDWVTELDRRLGGEGWTCLNLGFNGRRAIDVRRSLGGVIRLEPEVVVVMVGVNDVNGLTPIGAYRDELVRIVDRLQAETKARIGLCTLTAIGDAPESRVMKRSAAFNAEIREIATQKGVACIDVARAQLAWLEEKGRPAPRWGMWAFVLLLLSSVVQHYVFQLSWDRISRVHGLRLTTDLVHQNSVGGTMVADLVEQFVRSA